MRRVIRSVSGLLAIGLIGQAADARFLQTDPSGYKDGPNWYAYVRNDPVNARDPDGQRIDYVVHEVALGIYHGKIVINPDNQSLYKNDKRFITSDMSARISTIGAGPERGVLPTLMGFGGRLVSGVNRDRDLKEPGILVETLKLPKGVNEDQMISRLFQLDKSYKDDLPYELFPRKDDGNYNSNSYVQGLGRAAGFSSMSQPRVNAPGSDKPVPLNNFSLPKSCAMETGSHIQTCQ